MAVTVFSSLYTLRPEGPAVARPGRKAGIPIAEIERRRRGTKCQDFLDRFRHFSLDRHGRQISFRLSAYSLEHQSSQKAHRSRMAASPSCLYRFDFSFKKCRIDRNQQPTGSHSFLCFAAIDTIDSRSGERIEGEFHALDSPDFSEQATLCLYAAFSVSRSEENASLTIFAIRMSTIINAIFRQNSWTCSAATESNMTRDMFLIECRAFDARFHPDAYPGLTAGPIHCRPFGPDPPDANV